MIDFKAEDAIVDAYVSLKGTPEAQALAVTLIENFFIPQERIEEAQDWLEVISDQSVKSAIRSKVQKMVKEAPAVSLIRLPENTTWEDTDVSSPVTKNNDQQYHYDRLIKYSLASEVMVSDQEDVRTCPNEWVTFWSKLFIEKLSEYGVQMNTIAMAMNDYIHHILLKPSSEEPKQAAAVQTARRRVIDPPRNYLRDRPDMIGAIESSHPEYFESHCFGYVDGTEKVSGVRSDTLLFTDMGVLIFKTKFTGKVKNDVRAIPLDQVSNIEIGSDTHTEKAGLVSNTTEYLTLKINSADYTSVTRYLYLGKNESEINQFQPYIMRLLNDISGTYQLVEGDSWVSSSGYTMSFGVINY